MIYVILSGEQSNLRMHIAKNLSSRRVADAIEGVLANDESFFYSTQAEGQEELFGVLARIAGQRILDFDGIELNEVTVRIMDDLEIPIYFGSHCVMTENWVPIEGEYAAILFFVFARRPSLDLKPFASDEQKSEKAVS